MYFFTEGIVFRVPRSFFSPYYWVLLKRVTNKKLISNPWHVKKKKEKIA